MQYTYYLIINMKLVFQHGIIGYLSDIIINMIASNPISIVIHTSYRYINTYIMPILV